MVVGPSPPRELNGVIRTDSILGLRFRASTDTTTTQWRTGGVPTLAVHISPRRETGQLAPGLFIEIDLAGLLGQGVLKVVFRAQICARQGSEIGLGR